MIYADNVDYYISILEIMYLLNIDYINFIQNRLFQAIILKDPCALRPLQHVSIRPRSKICKTKCILCDV